MPMNWDIHEEFLNIKQQITNIAQQITVDFTVENSAQYEGRRINLNLWNNLNINRLFPEEFRVCSPNNIITCFGNDNFMEGLILTINWGVMNRAINSIFRENINTIERYLKKCKDDIEDNNNICNSWNWMTNDLRWTKVMSSKLLHFLCRSLGHTNVPSPIDGGRIIRKFKPHLKNFLNENRTALNITSTEINKFLSWNNNDLTSYLKYMAFILTWSNELTIEFESRLFNNLEDELRPALRLINRN